MSLWLYNSDEQTLTRYQLSGVTVRHTDFDYLGNDRDYASVGRARGEISNV